MDEKFNIKMEKHMKFIVAKGGSGTRDDGVFIAKEQPMPKPGTLDLLVRHSGYNTTEDHIRILPLLNTSSFMILIMRIP
jgi:hypothetical protein